MAKKQPSKKLEWNSDKEKTAFLDFVETHVSKILQCGDISHFQLSRMYSIKTGGMEVDIDYKYLEFELGYGKEWAIKLWRAKNYWFLIKYLCHEMAHIVVEEIDHHIKADKKYKSSQVRFYFERVTEHTSRWLCDSYSHYCNTFSIEIATGYKQNKK